MIDSNSIYQKLDQTVIGQTVAKQALAVSADRFQRSACMRDGGFKACSPSPVLLVGRTGSGKTFLVQQLAEILGVPWHTFDAGQLVTPGIVGLHPQDIENTMLKEAGGNARLAEHSLIHLDEVDKIAERSFGGHADIGGVSAQQTILKMLENSNRLFVLSGSFETTPFHLTKNPELMAYNSIFKTPARIPTKWLTQRGLIPELVGRLSERVALSPLTGNDFRKILLQSERSPLQELKRCFEVEGVSLTFEETAIDALVSLAKREPTGARALTDICNERLRSLWMLLPNLKQDVSAIVVDHDVILCGSNPLATTGQKLRRDVKLRSFKDVLKAPRSNEQESGQTSIATDNEINMRDRIRAARKNIGWKFTPEEVRDWWLVFEREQTPDVVLSLANQLMMRNATISELYSAYIHSETEKIQDILDCLDNRRQQMTEDDDDCPFDNAT